MVAKMFLKPLRFESYVNFAGSKAPFVVLKISELFESYVNFAGSKAIQYSSYRSN